MSLADECRDPSQEASCRSTSGERILGAGVSGSNRSARAIPVAIATGLILCAAWLSWPKMKVAGATNSRASIAIDYPLNNSVFPPDMEAPTFQWRDPAEGVARWQIDVKLDDGSLSLHVISKGEGLKIGEIDPRCVSANNKLPALTAEQAAAHTWKPDAAIWAAIREHAVDHAATISISGYAEANAGEALSRGVMQLSVSRDPVGAPLFYRDVPLMPSATEKGVIKPLAPSAVPLIEWRMRNISEPSSHVVMTDLHSCANCHSFSRDGKTLGLDMDGPQNNKGLYALVPVAQKMTVRTQDMISWAKFTGEMDSQSRLGFMSQVSPDGRYVATTIKPPGTKSWQFYYIANFLDYRFLQVFYPTRGILAWYDRESGKMQPLPGADDPKLVQASAVWSPDGKYLVFARAEAKDPNPADGKLAAYANDPAEVQIQYDLYRIPFNGGRGGKAEPIAGASQNGMSTSFPKISPDGKWMVFVQAHNGQLMRPDGKLYIVPAAGGKARLMKCNTSLMNSWHSFSPNGRWMVFSSKSRTPYTQMFLTHIDEDGNDSPAILIENSTAANRAVNIPEFVNMNRNGIEHIDTPAVDLYKQIDIAADLTGKGQYEAATVQWKKAMAMEPDDPGAHYGLGQTMFLTGKVDEGIAQFREALRLDPHSAEAHNGLGTALGHAGNASESIEQFHLALEDRPGYAEAHNNLGTALLGEHSIPEAEKEFKAAIEDNPNFAEAHNNLGSVYAAEGKVDEAVEEYRRAIAINPGHAPAYNNLGLALATKGDLDEAIAEFRKTVELEPTRAEAEYNLGHALTAKGSVDEAISHFQKALDLGPESAEFHTNLGIALAKRGQLADAVPHFERALALSPDAVDARYYLGKALVMSGRGTEGLAYWKQALSRDPDNLQVLNDFAWVLATSSDSVLRDGNAALPLAEHAVELTLAREPAILGTLAAVYAETGSFEKAIELEQRATELATQQGNARLAQSLNDRLALFQNKTPIRQ
jgi:tetratricopeptide (TPR) repeat protein